MPATHLLVRPIGLVLVLVISTLGVLGIQPALAAPVAGTLASSVTDPIVKEQVVLTGSLPPSRSRPITLMRRQGTGAWTNVTPTNSNASGGFTFTVTMPATVNTAVAYRVLARQVTLAGTSYPAIQTPDVVLRTVAQSASLAAPTSVPLGSQYRLDAAFAPPRAGRVVVFQRRQGTSWVNVSQTTQAADGTAFVNVNATALGNVSFRALTKKSSGAPQIVSATRDISIVAEGDTTPPPIPVDVSATAGDGEVDVTWSPVTAVDLVGYRVYRAPSSTGPWTLADETGPAADNLLVDNLTNGTDYWFAVSSFDADDNESGASTAVSATPTDLTPPPTVVLLSATPGDGEAVLVWEALTDVDLDGYRVYQGAEEAGPFNLVADNVNDTTHTVTGLTNGATYWFRVTGVDANDNESDPSQSLAVVPADTTAPGIPAGLIGTTGDTEATLNWDAAGASDVAGYRVYSGVSETGPWSLATPTLVTGTTYEATGLTNGTTYWWVVTSVDDDGNESAYSDPESVTPVDQTPPPVPTTPTTQALDKRVNLSWGGQIPPDLLGFIVYVATDEAGPWTALTPAPIPSPPYDALGLTNGTEYWFSVSAVDTLGNESARSGANSATPFDNVPPPVPAGVQVTGQLNGVEVSWDAVVDPGLIGYHVLRGSSATGPWSQLNFVPTTETTFLDETAVEGENYWYAVMSRDNANNYSGVSDAVGVTVYAPFARAEVLSAGAAHTCRVKPNGTLWCWGLNTYGELGDGTATSRITPTRIGAASDWASVSASSSYTCGVKTDNTAWCWGWNGQGQLGDGTTDNHTTPAQVGSDADWELVSSGSGLTCGLRLDHTAWCWGAGQPSVPTKVGTDQDWTSISSGGGAICGIKSDRSLWCWGYNGTGQVGDGTTTNRTAPVRIGSQTWQHVDLSERHACGVQTTGTTWCWGFNYYGQLGDGSTSDRLAPVQVGADSTWDQVSTSSYFTCAIKTDGTAWCWGFNGNGQFGNGSQQNATAPQQVGSNSDWKSISSGGSFTCALKTDEATWCWGDNSLGQLGNGRSQVEVSPLQVGSSLQWASVATGGEHSCGLRQNSDLWCWGSNFQGQVGNGSSDGDVEPVRVAEAVIQVSASSNHTCAVKSDGTLWCWGYNSYGRLGDGTTQQRLAPVQVGNDTTWRQVATGPFSTCATKTDGTAWCWGYNGTGRLGDGTQIERHTPVQVGSGTDWREVSIGESTSCGTQTNGSVWCWGDNRFGSLGNGSNSNSFTPTPITNPNQLGWLDVDVSGTHVCGTQTDSSLWCWGGGYENYGQLGIGTGNSGIDRYTPVRLNPTSGWAPGQVGTYDSCAVRSDNTGWCWGQNYWGNLGDGTKTDRFAPHQVGNEATWTEIDPGGLHTCGVKTDGSAWCWGLNRYGGIGTPLARKTPELTMP